MIAQLSRYGNVSRRSKHEKYVVESNNRFSYIREEDIIRTIAPL